jgi:hypothetical protein
MVRVSVFRNATGVNLELRRPNTMTPRINRDRLLGRLETNRGGRKAISQPPLAGERVDAHESDINRRAAREASKYSGFLLPHRA